MGKMFVAQGRVTEVFSAIWPNIELVRDFMAVLVTCKFVEDLIKNEVAILRSLWELSVAVKTRDLIQTAPNIPHPHDATYKI